MKYYELAYNLYKFNNLDEQNEIIEYLNKKHKLTSPPAQVHTEVVKGLILIDLKCMQISFIDSQNLIFTG